MHHAVSVGWMDVELQQRPWSRTRLDVHYWKERYHEVCQDGSLITKETLHQGNPCWVFSSFQVFLWFDSMTATDHPGINNKVFVFIRKLASTTLLLLGWMLSSALVQTFSRPSSDSCDSVNQVSATLWFLIFHSLVDGFLWFLFTGCWKCGYHIANYTGTDPVLAKRDRAVADRAVC